MRVIYEKTETGEFKQVEYPKVTMQHLLNVGLNAFAVKLLAEAVSKHSVTEPLSFQYQGVGITIEPLINLSSKEGDRGGDGYERRVLGQNNEGDCVDNS